MARLAPKELKLSAGELVELQELINRHKTPQQIVTQPKLFYWHTRAKITRKLLEY
jgi:hypothetical protein